MTTFLFLLSLTASSSAMVVHICTGTGVTPVPGTEESWRESRVYQIRAFRKCDWDRICEALHTAPWHVMPIFDDINDKWCFFYGILSNYLDAFIPLN